MFEKYDVNKLYYCSINDFIPYAIDNFGGCISIDGENRGDYDTIVYLDDEKYMDINHPSRIINVINCPQLEMPIVSKDQHLYELKTETLRRVCEELPQKQKNVKSLQRLPFGRKRFV